MKKRTSYFICLCIWLLISLHLHAAEKPEISDGQTIYVPAYSHIYSGDFQRPFLLTVTLSIRNISPRHQIEITQVNYKAQGKIIKKFLVDPVIVNPEESIRFVIPQKDKEGGSGACFIVKWKSDQIANSPIVETIMIGAQNQQGISFTSRGRVIIDAE